jgi:hypothetical protein
MSSIKRQWLRTGLGAGVLYLVFSCCMGFTQDTSPQKASEAAKTTQEQGGSGVARKPYSGLTRPEVEVFLRTGKVVEERAASRGVTNSKIVTLDDGKLKHRAHIQTVDISKNSFQTDRGTEINFRDSYKFNIAAYELDKLLELEMVPPSVERKVRGDAAAFTWFIEDTMMEVDRKKKNLEPPDQQLWNQQMYLCRVFNQLIYETDPNLGNLLITKDWKICLIDHTRAFRTSKDLQNSKNLVQCDRKLLAKLRELNKEVLQEKLGPYLTKTEIEGILGRRDKIVKFFNGQVAQKGEAAVLFDLERR